MFAIHVGSGWYFLRPLVAAPMTAHSICSARYGIERSLLFLRENDRCLTILDAIEQRIRVNPHTRC